MAESLSAILSAVFTGVALSNMETGAPRIDILSPGSSAVHTTTLTPLPNNEVAADITFNCPALREAFPQAALDSALVKRALGRIDSLESNGSVSAEHPAVEIGKDMTTRFAENIQDMYETLGVETPAVPFEQLRAGAEDHLKRMGLEPAMTTTPEEQRAIAEEQGRPYMRKLTVSCMGMS